jgi:MFS family permease
VSIVRERLREAFGAIRLVARNRNLRLLQLAWAASTTGTWAYGVALIVYAYGAGGATAVGVLGFARWTAAALAAPFTGVLGDRFARARVMVGSDLVRVGALVGGAFAAFADASVVVYLLAGVISVAATAFRPAQAALVPALAETPEEVTAANVTASTIESIGIFVGPALGGFLLAVTSSGVVFLVTAGATLWSAVLVLAISYRPAPEEQPVETPEPVVAEVTAGFRTIFREPRVRLLVGLFTAQTFVAGALNVLVVVASLQLLDLGKAGVGYLNSAMGIGGLLGGVAAFTLVGRPRLAASFGLGILVWGAPIALVGVWPQAALALVLFGFVGVGNTLVDVAGITLLQRAAPDEVLARVFGVLESLLVGSIGLGAVAAPALVGLLGGRAALIVVGALLPVVVVLSWARLVRIDAEAAPPDWQLGLLRGIPIFAPLPGPTLEQLARLLTPVRFAQGAEIVRQGDPGDRYYVVAQGEVDISVDGRPPKTEGPGAGFGEIALLRDVPRTATVTARTNVELLTLDRDDFIGVVTGHAPSRDAAEALIGARLGTLVPV